MPDPCPADDSLYMASDRAVLADHPETDRFGRPAIPHEFCDENECREDVAYGPFTFHAPHKSVIVGRVTADVRWRSPLRTFKPFLGPTNVDDFPIIHASDLNQ